MIAVGQLDRQIVLYVRSQSADVTYGGIQTIAYELQSERIFANVVWKGGKVNEEGEQMQNNKVVEFYVRNGGVMSTANVEDYILYDEKKYYIDAIDIVDGRKKYLRVITSSVQV
tara:strand:- start:6496 stop:6837 length:342 start_codon:yes stop_codon:yes gene_type:complete